MTAITADPARHRRNGQALANWQLAKEYGFTDLDGSQPDWGRYYRDAVLGGNPALADTYRQQSLTVVDPGPSPHGKGWPRSQASPAKHPVTPRQRHAAITNESLSEGRNGGINP